MSLIQTIKDWNLRRKMLNIQQFAHAHRHFLVIIADPKDDTIFVSYRDKQLSGKISSADGQGHEVVKRLLKHSTFHSSIDRFLASLVDVLKCSVEKGSDFYKFIDGAVFSISQALSKRPEDKDAEINKLMNLIAEGKDVELYHRHKKRFTRESREYLESLLFINAEPSATK